MRGGLRDRRVGPYDRVRLAAANGLGAEHRQRLDAPALSGDALFLSIWRTTSSPSTGLPAKLFWRSALPVVRKKRFFSTWAGPTLAGNMLGSVSNDRRMIGVDRGDRQ
jgi:hypothetical protein